MKNKRSMLSLSLITFSTYLLINCTAIQIDNFSQVVGKEWNVVSLEEEELNAAELENGLPIITFHANNRLTGFTSCNIFNGTYKLDNTTITLDPGVMTKMMCYGDVELNFLAVLKTVNAFKLNKNSLELLNGSKIVMRLLPK